MADKMGLVPGFGFDRTTKDERGNPWDARGGNVSESQETSVNKGINTLDSQSNVRGSQQVTELSMLRE